MPSLDVISRRLATELVVSYVFVGLACVTTLIRLFTRWRVIKQPGLDDLLIASAMLFTVAILPAQHIMNPHIRLTVKIFLEDRESNPNSTRYEVSYATAYKMQYIVSLFYILAIEVVKLSILEFYRRILPPVPYHRIINVLSSVITLFMVVAFFVHIFQCWPVWLYWDTQYICKVNGTALHLAISLFGLLADLALLLLPVRVVLRLQASTKRKVGLLMVFSIGIFGTIATGLRLWQTLAVVDAYLNRRLLDGPIGWLPIIATVTMWSQMELNSIIICANSSGLVSLWNVIRHHRPKQTPSKPRLRAHNVHHHMELGDSQGAGQAAASGGCPDLEHSSSQEQMIPNYHEIVQSTTVDVTVEDIDRTRVCPNKRAG